MSVPAVTEFFTEVSRDPVLGMMTEGQRRFLAALASFSSPPPVGGVGAAANMASSQSARVMRSLTDLGFVERLPSTDGDLRITRVRLTDEGRAAYERLAKAYRNR